MPNAIGDVRPPPASWCALLRRVALLPLCLSPLAEAQPVLAGPGPAAPPVVIATHLASPGKPNRDIEANLLILDVRLDGSSLSDGLNAYQDGPNILVPLGELTRLLTLAVTVRADAGQASGYVLTEARTFGLNVATSVVSLSERESTFEVHLARVIGDDIYVSSRLLSRWFPLDIVIDMPSQQLRITPREPLPLQARLARERAALALGQGRPSEASNPGYPRDIAPYQLISQPLIDQTFGADARASPGASQRNSAYTAYITADVLGMEGAAYVNTSSGQPSPDWRLTLGRNDPDAGLLGPMRARSVSLGNITVPSVANVMSNSGTGKGVMVSNRALDQPTSFDRQSLRGDLPPGWDVTLYYNDALLGFQASRPDGLYAFDDLPLSFGPNEFSLVFNGPLGQMRSERKSFLLDQSAVKPGEVLYSLAEHHADRDGVRSVARVDIGLTSAIGLSAAYIRMPRPSDAAPEQFEERRYTQIGLRGYTDLGIVTSEFTLAPRGLLAELGLKTRLAGFAVDLLHTEVQGDFDSDVFSLAGDPVKQRDRLRVLGSLALPGLPRLPMALDAQRETLKSGAASDTLSGRLSWMMANTAFTNSLGLQRAQSAVSSFGNLQATRRVAEMGVSGQLGYSVKPVAHIDTLAINADRNLTSGYRINAGFLRTFSGGSSMLAGGVSKNFGRYALAISGSVSGRGDIGLGLQLFVALGREPRTGAWFADPLPMAGMGAVSARAFVDKNLNGLRDEHEEFVTNAGFLINNGGRHPARSADDGTAFLGRLSPGQFADIALDPATLEDPLWKPSTRGVRVLPRPGLVQQVEFAVVSTSEIDGTVSLLDRNGRRPVGDAVIELVDAAERVVLSTVSSSDGFYLLREVMPGQYTLRISPEQAEKLLLQAQKPWQIDVGADGGFISGRDMEMTRRE